MLCVSMHKCLNVCVPEQFIATCNRLQSFAGVLFSNPKVRLIFVLVICFGIYVKREEGIPYIIVVIKPHRILYLFTLSIKSFISSHGHSNLQASDIKTMD